jgi:thiamine transport system substrate-binding protein
VALLALTAAALSVALARGAEPPELVIYAYDSFVAKGGPGPELLPLFEKSCGCHVRALGSGDAGQLVTRLQLDAERGAAGADVVVGLDQHTWEKARALSEPWGKWLPKGYDQLEVKVGDGFLPFDYGVLAFIVDRKKLATPPAALADLMKPELRRNLILEDPRTSTPGLGFLLYTRELLGEGAWDFWSRLRTQWLTLAPGWDAAYGIFLREEAPLVWSYTTSQAYHEAHGDAEGRYRAVLFREGQPVQVEGAALVRGRPAAQAALARRFLEFLLTPEAQERLALKNWMLPARKGVKLPESFAKLPKPARLLGAKPAAGETAAALSGWIRAVEASK